LLFFDVWRTEAVVVAVVVVGVVAVVVVVPVVAVVVVVVAPGEPGSPGPVHAQATPPPVARLITEAATATVLRGYVIETSCDGLCIDRSGGQDLTATA
jgi:hypothetical protein